MTTPSDAVMALRRYQDSGPWRLQELLEVAEAVLDAAGISPEKPTSERTVRFYVTRGVVEAPYGRGAGSSWGYRHLVELLAVRLAQHGGETLEQIAAARVAEGPNGLERLVTARLGPAFFRPRLVRDTPGDLAPVSPPSVTWQRVDLGDGAELHLAGHHPLLKDDTRLRTFIADVQRLIHLSALARP